MSLSMNIDLLGRMSMSSAMSSMDMSKEPTSNMGMPKEMKSMGQLRELIWHEAAAVGSAWGDAIEITALTKVLSAAGNQQVLSTGNFKGSLGHAEPASGMVGLVKT